jgi:uncharacterized protein (DUF427 family)
MPRAIWNGVILAEAAADAVQRVEGNVYFPPEAVDRTYLRESRTHTVCPWKGTASYYDVVVDGEVNRDAAWYYPVTKPAAEHIAGHVAFGTGVPAADDKPRRSKIAAMPCPPPMHMVTSAWRFCVRSSS